MVDLLGHTKFCFNLFVINVYEEYGLFQNVLHQDWLPLKILQKKYQMSGKLKPLC